MSGTILVYNPKSGRGNHGDEIRRRAELRGYDLERTDAPGDAIRLARRAAETGYSTIVAGGGDGTVNEVVRGMDRANAFEDVTLGIVPLGTGNNFATQLGIPDLDTAFDVVANGERRRIDLGRATDRPFVNSCVAGLTADSSGETSSTMKDRLGVLAYVLTTLRSARDFDPPRLAIDTEERGSEPTAWTGDALCVLVGNGRRFTTEGGDQADMEDGLFDVSVIRDVPTIDLLSDTVIERLFGRNSEHIVRSQTASLTITVRDSEPIRFSLDGEIVQRRRLSIESRPRTLAVAVGDTYERDPDRER